MPKLLILGGGISQLPTIQSARKLGVTSLVLDGSPNALCRDKADIFMVCDIKDHEKVLEIAKKEKIDGIVCPGTDFPYVAAFVAMNLNLPGLDPVVAAMCQNKFVQRKRLEEGSFFVPRFILIKDKKSITNINELSFPIVIKPVDSMAARGVRVTHNFYEITEAYAEAFAYSRIGQVIAEEFVEGMEFSIDALIYDGEVNICGFADRHFTLYPYLIENGHTCPSILDKEAQEYIGKAFKEAVKFLGIKFGAVKGDIKLTEKGIMIGEIAARISGGFLSGWTYPYTSGIHPHDNLIRLHLGQKIVLEQEQNLGFSAERILFSIPGKIKSIINLDKTQEYPGIKFIQLHVHEGDDVFFPSNNAKRCGSAISFNKGRSDAIYHAQIAAANTILRLEPQNKRTYQWLESEDDFRMFNPAKKETDWHDSDIEKGLEMVKAITGKPMKKILETKNFWKYFYRGGVQGGLFSVDSF